MLDPRWEPIAGNPALDFLNTVRDTGRTREKDLFESWSGVSCWASKNDLFSSDELKIICELSKSESGNRRFPSFLKFREELYTGLCRLHHNNDGSLLETLLFQSMERGCLTASDGLVTWQPGSSSRHIIEDRIALTLEAFLRSPDFARLKQCANCSWFFVDNGRGRGRKWCKMQTCGARQKMRRFRGNESGNL